MNAKFIGKWYTFSTCGGCRVIIKVTGFDRDIKDVGKGSYVGKKTIITDDGNSINSLYACDEVLFEMCVRTKYYKRFKL